MGYFSKLSEELGHSTGKGISWAIEKTIVGIFLAIGVFLVWYFAWKQDGKSFLKDNSFRIAVTAAIIAFFSVPNLVKFSYTHPDENPSGMVHVLAQLDSGKTITMPEKNLFRPVTTGEDPSSVHNGITYVRYQERTDGKTPHASAQSNYCIMVTAGEKIVIHSDIAPTDVINMDVTVEFVPQFEQLSDYGKFLYRHNLSVFGEGMIATRKWRQMSLNWTFADVSLNGRGFIATALSSRNIPYPHAGGMVCFL